MERENRHTSKRREGLTKGELQSFWWSTMSDSLARYLEEDSSDANINLLLEEVRQLFDAQSVHICELDATPSCLTCTFASKINKVNHPTPLGCRCDYPKLVNRLRKGDVVEIDVRQKGESRDLDETLYAHLSDHGISRMLAFPLRLHHRLLGFVGVDLSDSLSPEDSMLLASEENLQGMKTLVRLLSVCIELRRKEREAERRRSDLETLFSYMPLGYLHLQIMRDAEGKVVDFYVADANHRLAELTGTPLDSFLHHHGSAFNVSMQRTISFINDLQDDGCYRTFSHTFPVSQRLCQAVFYSTSPDKVVGLFLDMTEFVRTRNALDRSEVLFKQIFDNISAGVEIYDTDGRLIDINPKDMEIFGVKDKTNVMGLSLFENPNIPEQVLQQIRQQDIVDFFTDYSFKNLEGYYDSTREQSINLHTRMSKMYNSSCNHCGYMLISMDNTEQVDALKRVNDFEHFFLLISDYAKVGYAKYNLLNMEGYAIQQWFRNLGEEGILPLNQVAGIYPKMHPEDRDLIHQFLELVKKGEASSFSKEVRIERPGSKGEWNWVHAHVVVNSYQPEKGVIEIICVNYDITPLKETERKLIEAKEHAEEADRLKSAFLANMSHEIRTPLNAIVGFSSLMSEATDKEEMKQFQNIIEENTNLLLQLISDVLDISKIEAGTLEFYPQQVDMDGLCQDVVNSLADKTKPGVKLIFESAGKGCQLVSDPNRIRQVLNNFIGNAIKFTSVGSIRLGYTKPDENHLRCYVSDTGMGIDKEHQEIIFERFVKVNSFIQGTGLGLPICKNIIEQLGGEVGVESEMEKGSTFWFTLPIANVK